MGIIVQFFTVDLHSVSVDPYIVKPCFISAMSGSKTTLVYHSLLGVAHCQSGLLVFVFVG